MDAEIDGRPLSLDVRLSVVSLVGTAVWMPIVTSFIAVIGQLGNPLITAILVACWLGSGLVFFYPYALRVDDNEVVGTWVFGRTKRWSRNSLELAPAWSLPSSAFGARQVRCNGKTVFIIWSLMSDSDLALNTFTSVHAPGSSS